MGNLLATVQDNGALDVLEERAIQSHVGKRSHELAQAYFGRTVSTDLYMAKVGHFRTAIYQRIKETFNVPRYNELRRVDFDNAMTVIDIVNLNNLRKHQLRLTERQKDIARKNGDDITLFDLDK